MKQFARALTGVLFGLLFLWTNATAGVGMAAPEINNETWLNGARLHLADLKGKVVLVEFWTFGCYNFRNVEPYVKQWHQKYGGQGFVVIGVHSPSFRMNKRLRMCNGI